jgi:hypothetical protein
MRHGTKISLKRKCQGGYDGNGMITEEGGLRGALIVCA